MQFKQTTIEFREQRGTGSSVAQTKKMQLLIPKIAVFSFELIMQDKDGKRYNRSYKIDKYFGEHADYMKVNEYFIGKIGKSFSCEVYRNDIISVDFTDEIKQ